MADRKSDSIRGIDIKYGIDVDYVARSQLTPNVLAPITKFMAASKGDPDESNRQITFIISTSTRDRDGDIIVQEGWDLKEYTLNPQVLWAHKASELPIGRAENTAVEGGRLISTAVFATRDENPFADTIFKLYRGGFLNATSVGFEPKKIELIEGDEPGDIGFRFLHQKLLEYSAVPIPSNPDALVVARGNGIDIDRCDELVQRLLDERDYKNFSKEMLNSTYISLHGRLHQVTQADIAAMNIASLTVKSQEEIPDTPEKAEDEDDRPVMTTGNGGEDSHNHKFREGDPHTEPGGDDGHIHSITYSDDGTAVIEGNIGHTHDAPAGAAMPESDSKEHEDEDEEKSGAEATQEPESASDVVDAPEPEAATVEASIPSSGETKITDWPQPGMSLPVSLLTSEYRSFPVAEAKALRDDWPEIWAMGEGLYGSAKYVEWYAEPECIIRAHIDHEGTLRTREEWAAKNVDGYTLEDTVSQVRHLVRGSRGIEHMRLILSHAKEHVMNARDKAKGLSAEEIDAVTSRVVNTAVIPAVERALRKYSGRVS